MEPQDFDRRLQPWLDGELPADEAAAMDAAAASKPELAERAAVERALAVRVRRALVSDAGDAAVVRGLMARARAQALPKPAPRGKLFRFATLRAVAAAAAVVVAGMWWFCIPPFECSYMVALEQAGHAQAEPGAHADELAEGFRLPERVAEAVAAKPPACLCVDFVAWHRPGVRLDYVRPDGSAFHVVSCDSTGVRPSFRRHVDKDGQPWWICDVGCCHIVAFDVPGTDRLYAVTGKVEDGALFADAQALREAVSAAR